MFFLFIIASLLVSLVLQHFLGAVPPWGARVLLMPIVFFYGAPVFLDDRHVGSRICEWSFVGFAPWGVGGGKSGVGGGLVCLRLRRFGRSCKRAAAAVFTGPLGGSLFV